MARADKTWQIWIDRGGTFTDFVARRPDGSLVCHKLLSDNPACYRDAAAQGIRELLGLASDAPIPDGLIKEIRMGATVATNALLERKGARVLFVTTRGFGDLLRIGSQDRPRLFDLHIVLPAMLYERILELDERVDARGKALRILDVEQARPALQAALDAGITAVAIAFAHGYRYHAHERRLGELCRQLGFTQVSLSHEVSPLLKLAPRAHTTVADAYLSPVVRHYLQTLEAELAATAGPPPRLLFMQSGGGLIEAGLLRGKDAVLSGPAGGVVGMARAAAAAGFHKVIGFDMGGTSTDVTHYNGEYERSLETVVAGVRLRAPMMRIHTVAAGGGSVLRFDGARFRVGPESAGAVPGPACYRRGGPLTVTDCNILLGRLQADCLPATFGTAGNQRPDRAIVVDKFAALAREVAVARGLSVEPEQLAAGFLQVAVENMANAIKKVSLQRGYNVTEYALNCFGGAGGQHACMVADALGMKTILLHPMAGVLSAYGMGQAELRALRTEQLGIDFTSEAVAQELAERRAALLECAREELRKQGVTGRGIVVETRVNMRYQGSDTCLEVALADAERMQSDFENAHRQRFGFSAPARQLVMESLSVEAIAAAAPLSEPETAPQVPDAAAPAHDMAQVYCDGQWRAVPRYARADLPVGLAITGPALITEAMGAVALERGWRGTVNGRGHLLLERYAAPAVEVMAGTDPDPMLLEVFNNLFMSVAEQMGVTLQNTAHSVNIKERQDFSCALFTAEGELVANAPHIPVHLGSMGASVRALLAARRGHLKPGDVYALNSPYAGGTHLPDVTVVTPVFDEPGTRLLFFLGARGHHADIGGRTPGSAPPDSVSIEEEGVLIDDFLLVENGELRAQALRALLAGGRYPCRNIEQNLADLAAQVAANRTGMTALRKLVARYGMELVGAYMQHVQDNAEEAVRRVIDTLDDGEFAYRMDDGALIRVAITVDRAGRRATVDFTGTSGQHPGNYNAPESICRAALLYVLRTLVADDIPLNEGCLRPIKLILPRPSMVAPEPPAAVMAGNVEVSQAIANALYGALDAQAASQGTMNNVFYGNERYQNYETICGGTGAGPTYPGASTVHSHMTNTRMTDPEALELNFPVLVEEFSIRRGSGGAGRHCGGDGAVRKLRFREAMTVTILSSHRTLPPFGLHGGAPGKCGSNQLVRANGKRESLGGNAECKVSAGDLLVVETPGGGGYGRPGDDKARRSTP